MEHPHAHPRRFELVAYFFSHDHHDALLQDPSTLAFKDDLGLEDSEWFFDDANGNKCKCTMIVLVLDVQHLKSELERYCDVWPDAVLAGVDKYEDC